MNRLVLISGPGCNVGFGDKVKGSVLNEGLSCEKALEMVKFFESFSLLLIYFNANESLLKSLKSF